MEKTSLWKWLNERLGVSDFLTYAIPRHANRTWYMLGGITVALILVQGVTGVLLSLYYHPQPEAPGAYESVRFLISEVPLGAFVRNLHFWVGQAIVVLVSLHLLRIFYTGSYKAPRELNWIVGVGLLALTVAFTFSGTVLKWDQEGYEALAHNTEIGELLGGLGYWFIPEYAGNVPILTRIFVAHVSILPVLALIALGLHFYLIRRHGIS